MKSGIFKIFAGILCIVVLFSGCGFNSGMSLLKVESSTGTSWKQSHHFLSGTENRTLSLGSEMQEMEIEVVTEEGEIDIKVTDRDGGDILTIEDAETGSYEFTAKGRIKIKIEAKEHRGSFEIKKQDS